MKTKNVILRVADSSEYFDWNKAEVALFPNLKPTSRSISIRIPGVFA